MILGQPPNMFTIIAKVFGAILSACFAAIFGIAIRRVDSRGYANPRAAGNRYQEYVRLVWETPVLKAPGY